MEENRRSKLNTIYQTPQIEQKNPFQYYKKLHTDLSQDFIHIQSELPPREMNTVPPDEPLLTSTSMFSEEEEEIKHENIAEINNSYLEESTIESPNLSEPREFSSLSLNFELLSKKCNLLPHQNTTELDLNTLQEDEKEKDIDPEEEINDIEETNNIKSEYEKLEEMSKMKVRDRLKEYTKLQGSKGANQISDFHKQIYICKTHLDSLQQEFPLKCIDWGKYFEDNIDLGVVKKLQEISSSKENITKYIYKTIKLPRLIPAITGFGKTLILDLDKTLIYSLSLNNKTNLKLIHESKNLLMTETLHILFLLRPNALRFLQEMSTIFEIIIYTSAEDAYARDIIHIIDPTERFISHIFTREWCSKLGSTTIKDLEIFENRERKNLIIIDDNVSTWVNCLDNLVPLIPFEGDEDDTQLFDIMGYLLQLLYVEDVRDLNKKYINI